MIIDARCRLTTKEGSDYFRTQTQKSGMFGKIEAFKDGTEETFFDEIGQSGVTTAVSVSGNNPGMKLGYKQLPDRTTSNDMMAEVQKRHWGRFIGVAGIERHPRRRQHHYTTTGAQCFSFQRAVDQPEDPRADGDSARQPRHAQGGRSQLARLLLR